MNCDFTVTGLSQRPSISVSSAAPDLGDRLDPLVVDAGLGVGELGGGEVAGVDRRAELLARADQLRDVGWSTYLLYCVDGARPGPGSCSSSGRWSCPLTVNVQCICDAPGQLNTYLPGCSVREKPPDRPGVRFSCSPRMCERSLVRSSASETAPASLLLTLTVTWPGLDRGRLRSAARGVSATLTVDSAVCHCRRRLAGRRAASAGAHEELRWRSAPVPRQTAVGSAAMAAARLRIVARLMCAGCSFHGAVECGC